VIVRIRPDHYLRHSLEIQLGQLGPCDTVGCHIQLLHWVRHGVTNICAMGAFALYLHYIHDVADVDTKYNIDYTVNKSWHAVSISVFLSHEILALISYRQNHCLPAIPLVVDHIDFILLFTIIFIRVASLFLCVHLCDRSVYL